jgi:hypothetical protein
MANRLLNSTHNVKLFYFAFQVTTPTLSVDLQTSSRSTQLSYTSKNAQENAQENNREMQTKVDVRTVR